MKLSLLCMVFPLSMLLGNPNLAAASDAGSQLEFKSASMRIDDKGGIVSADAIELIIPGGMLIAPRAFFPSWDGDQANEYELIKIEGNSSIIQSDGTELRFNGGVYERGASRITFMHGATVVFNSASFEGAKTLVSVEWTCAAGSRNLKANGEFTGLTSVCVAGGTRLSCGTDGKLRAVTFSPLCQTP